MTDLRKLVPAKILKQLKTTEISAYRQSIWKESLRRVNYTDDDEDEQEWVLPADGEADRNAFDMF